MSTAQASTAQLSVRPASPVPVRKVQAGGFAGALTILLVFALNSFVLPAEKPITGEIASALTTVFTFIVSYMVPSAATDPT